MVKLTERICEACGTKFTTGGPGRPQKLCPQCRSTEIIGTVRVVRLPESGCIRIQQRRPGKKTKFVNTDLTVEEATRLIADLGFKLAGSSRVPEQEVPPPTKSRKAG